MDSGASRPRIIASDLTESEQTITVTPLLFLHVLHNIFPQFELGEQQDANECFCELLRLISDELIVPIDNENNTGSSNNENQIRLKKFFEIKYQVKTKCLEEGSTEEVQTSEETGYQVIIEVLLKILFYFFRQVVSLANLFGISNLVLNAK